MSNFSFDRASCLVLRVKAPYVVASLMAVVFLMPLFCAAESDPAKDEAGVVAQSENMKDCKKALILLESYLAKHPDAVSALFHAAQMANMTGQHKKTVHFATRYLQLKTPPVDPYIYHLRAHGYGCTGERTKALTDLAVARKAQPKDTEVLILMGDNQRALGHYNEALANFALAAKMNDLGGLSRKVELEIERADARNAAADYSVYVSKTGDILVPLGQLQRLIQDGKGATAISVMDAMLQANIPKAEEQLMSMRANALLKIGRPKEALQACDAYERKFKRTDLYTLKYLILWPAKDYEQSLVCLNAMIKTRPQERGLYLLRGDCYRALDEYAKALADYDRVSDLVMKDVQKRRERAECNYQVGRFQEAATELDAVNGIAPTAAGYERQGQCLSALKRYKDAIVCFSRAVKLKPLSGEFISVRGDCYRRLKDYPHALKDFSDAIALNPDNMVYVFGRGLCFLELSRNEDAVKDFTAAMKNPHLMNRALLERAKAYDNLGDTLQAQRDRSTVKQASKTVEDDFFR